MNKGKEEEMKMVVEEGQFSQEPEAKNLELGCRDQENVINQLKKENLENESNLHDLNDKLMAMVKELQKKNTDQDKELTEFKEHNTKLISALDETTN